MRASATWNAPEGKHAAAAEAAAASPKSQIPNPKAADPKGGREFYRFGSATVLASPGAAAAENCPRRPLGLGTVRRGGNS